MKLSDIQARATLPSLADIEAGRTVLTPEQEAEWAERSAAFHAGMAKAARIMFPVTVDESELVTGLTRVNEEIERLSLPDGDVQ